MPLTPPVTLRTATAADRELLVAVFGSTRMDELALTDWSDEQKDQFCRMQFAAQDSHYTQHYPTAEYSVIDLAGAPAGRLTVDRWQNEIRVMDIAILPEFRGRGIATYLLRALQDEAAASNRCISIHVERSNPALRLYQRLGFQTHEETGLHLLMQWHPADPPR